MATIHIDYAASKEAVARVRAHLDDLALRDVNWNGADFEIERDDYTWIEGGDSYKSAALLNDVQRILQESKGAIAQYQVQADRETGEWLGEPEYVGIVDRQEWLRRTDTDSAHFDTYEVEDETRAIEVKWAE